MSLATQDTDSSAAVLATQPNLTRLETQTHKPGQLRVIRRNGKVTTFDSSKIAVAMTKAFLALEGGSAAESRRVHDIVTELTEQIAMTLARRMPDGGTVHIEDIQDQVELALMRGGHHKVARAYVLYREEHARLRSQQEVEAQPGRSALQVTLVDGSKAPLDEVRLRAVLQEACQGLAAVDQQRLYQDTLKSLYDGVPETDLSATLIMTARTLIEHEPEYSYVCARLLLDTLRREALSLLAGADVKLSHQQMGERYGEYFIDYLKRGVELELLDETLLQFDVAKLAEALLPERDLQFNYLGLQTLYDRYFIHHNSVRFELPQAFFMRVAMGLAINEIDREARAIEFYQLLSSFDFMSSTPTLFNSGTLRPQLSSCYLTTVPDDLDGIFSAIKDDALLSKFAGGLGNDWSRVRAMGAHIKGTNGKSQGVVPFLKVANDTAVAVNQCFAPDVHVFTAEGVKPIKDVRRGDLVLGQRGQYREVLKHMTYNQTDAMVELTLKHAIHPVQVTAGHPVWAIKNVPMEQACARTLAWLEKGKVEAEWVEAGELACGDYVAQVIPEETVAVPGFSADDARFYGILLGDGHVSKEGLEWGVSGNPAKDTHLTFVRNYLEARGIHCWLYQRNAHYLQIRWSAGRGLARCATTGQFVSNNEAAMPFSPDDIYASNGQKHIARRFSHLPKSQTLALLQGLLETDGGVSRGKEIYFTNTSYALIEGVRYQLLRLGIPCAGQYREREQTHTGQRIDGSDVHFNGTVSAYDLRIPAVSEIAERVGCQSLSKCNWIRWKNWLFTRVRAVNPIAPVPFVHDLQVEGDHSYMTVNALAHNGGKRKGAMCAYLETWHLDIEEFLELRKNTGDDRRRTHDMNSANWIPDLFMKRVAEEGEWTLFSPDQVPDLHDLYGEAFEQAYLAYEEKALRGEIKLHKRIPALTLWRKMLSMLFETGHPWITFKDPCNIRSPQQHVGVVHSSNLCTEITLNTSDSEIAVCNLGSINLPAHLTKDGVLDVDKLRRTVRTAMRMLDNVIDYNYYSVPQARRANLRHRPVGLGVMGFQDCLYQLRLPYASEQAVSFADHSMEQISYFVLEASADLAEERGAYSSYQGSLWSQGVLPIDSVAWLKQQRGDYLQQDDSHTLDWAALRQRIQAVGLRNSNTMAIAPTATIANICGVSQSIEPTYQNLFVKSNLSGEFTVINPYLVTDLKQRGLWDAVMINDLKYYDGSIQRIDRIPDDLKQLYRTAFEIDPRWLVEAASRRQKWLDQGQSLNLYLAEPDGKKLDALYKLAWLRGLKTTYYLRTVGATHVEKSTLADGRLNAVKTEPDEVKACSILDPECEACQ
ncbi:MAG: ribonucleoside-diphosphate reductase subunit alpha [Methylococcales bacterium]|nr:ribonucleoside-diphosphate reductase subunit alpha [Methylococcales bacterium]